MCAEQQDVLAIKFGRTGIVDRLHSVGNVVLCEDRIARIPHHQRLIAHHAYPCSIFFRKREHSRVPYVCW